MANNEENKDSMSSKRHLESLSRSISPPRKRKRSPRIIKSPWQLTWIRDLPASENKDAVTLSDLLNDPMISECWEFNYLHDIPFLMNAFDPDTRHLVKVHVVHGFWKREDPNRQILMQQAAEFENVKLYAAPMPEMFGTHHSKMMILFRHDDNIQVIVHTANMIAKDWTNMTNGVWRSPLLPLLPPPPPPPGDAAVADNNPGSTFPLGSGERFKIDLMRYLSCYNKIGPMCKPLIDHIDAFDFSSIRGAFIASTPGRHSITDKSAIWGWNALQKCLKVVDCCSEDKSHIAVQISSIATLGAKDDWLQNTLFKSLSTSKNHNTTRPSFKVVFPTADEIRQSLDGYRSGASIHTKTQSQQQSKQLEYLKPIFHHWANDSVSGLDVSRAPGLTKGGRDRAAPHIKTYVRYTQENTVQWALLTSANLSKQAWGEATGSTGQMRVASWETGVLVWPELFGHDAVMKATFKSDDPDAAAAAAMGGTNGDVIGIRIPYSVPLQRYGANEVPWVASMSHLDPDWLGETW